MSDDLTKKLADLGLDERAQEKARQAMGSVGGYVAAREEKLQALIERTAGQVDERTDRRWSEAVDKVRAGLLSGVHRLAEEKPDAATDADGPEGDGSEGDGSERDGPGAGPDARPEGPPLS